MDHIIIREASLSDIDTLLVFEQGVISAERPFDETLGKDPIHYYKLEEMIAATHIQLLVAELHGRLVGSGYARIEKARPFLHYKEYAYMGFMYTHPDYRGKGINQKIIAALAAWTLEKGVHELRLEVYVNNTAAINAYVKAGFSSLLQEMRMGI